ncbi:hypothetical protein M2232_004364 [Bradyrhizobium japonicum]|nr:hypothetical protein [Bradyrhizobium japonicum]MCW2345446.1 hypothetical protein [Bradyrhizobium japonicum]
MICEIVAVALAVLAVRLLIATTWYDDETFCVASGGARFPPRLRQTDAACRPY